MAFVGDSNPIDSAKHDRLFGTQEYNAAATQRKFVDPLHRIVRHGGSERRRRIDVKCREPDGWLGKSGQWIHGR